MRAGQPFRYFGVYMELLLKSHCQQSLSLLATACSEQSLLATTSTEKSLLPTASSEQSLLLLLTVTAVCVHARACICAEVYMYHSTGNLSTFMPFYNVFTQNLIPIEGKSGHSLLLLPTVTAVYHACVRARACMRTEVYIYHSTGKICTCMSLYNVLTQNSIRLEGNSYCCYDQQFPFRMVDKIK